MARQFHNICLALDYLLPIRNPVDRSIQRYIFPFQFCLGFVGNTLNLFILLSPSLKCKTNILLACMAMADLIFLLSLLPTSLAAFSPFDSDPTFVQSYQTTKTNQIAIANWFSATSAWLTVTVTLERLTAIKFPFKAKMYWRPKRLWAIVALIVLVCFGITFFHHVSHTTEHVLLCNDTQHIYVHRPISLFDLKTNSSNAVLVAYVSVSAVVSAVMTVFVPLVALLLLNALLIHSLKTQHKKLLEMSVDQEHDISIRRRFGNSERKVSIMVIVIVVSFTATTIPSAVIWIWHSVYSFGRMSEHFYHAASISNSLVVSGKVLNFFLYCSSSASFRTRLMALVRKRGGTTYRSDTNWIFSMSLRWDPMSRTHSVQRARSIRGRSLSTDNTFRVNGHLQQLPQKAPLLPVAKRSASVCVDTEL